MKESVYLKYQDLFPNENKDKDIKIYINKLKDGRFLDIHDMYFNLFNCCDKTYKEENNSFIPKIWDSLPLKLIYYDALYSLEKNVSELILKIKTISILLELKNNSNLYINKLLESIYYLYWCKMQVLFEDLTVFSNSELDEASFLVFNGCFSGKADIEIKIKGLLMNNANQRPSIYSISVS